MKRNKPQGVGIRILLIEDDEDAAEAMTLTLSKLGVPVKTVFSGERGVEEWKKGGYDVVVSDIRMPGLDGMGVLRAIRAQDADFPVILLTAYEQIDTAIEALRLGAQDYIVKPVPHIDTLLMSVQKAVDHHRLLLEHRAMTIRLKSLASELLKVEEKERRQLASNLHDALGQSFVIMKMKIEEIASLAPDGRMKDLARDACEILGETLHQTRSLIFNLSPPILYDLGLEAALDSLVVQIHKTHGQIVHYSPGNVSALVNQEASIVLFRALRELLHNAIKHAEATRIALSSSCVDGKVVVAVEDNGVGFDVARVMSYGGQQFGYGLFSIREQMQNIGGTMEVNSTKGAGTKVVLKVAVDGALEGKEDLK
jgi:signal transduction histidine kinase